MTYCLISKEELYFRLAVFCLFEGRATEFNVVYITLPAVIVLPGEMFSVHFIGYI
jgi:hypothetical protein